MGVATDISNKIKATLEEADLESVSPADKTTIVCMVARLLLTDCSETAGLVGEAIGPYDEAHYGEGEDEL